MINRLKRRVGSLVRQTPCPPLTRNGRADHAARHLLPHAQTTYSVPVYRDQVLQVGGEPLPIPPQHRSGRITAHLLNFGCRREGRLRDHAPHLA